MPTDEDIPVKRLEEVLGDDAINFDDIVPKDFDKATELYNLFDGGPGHGCSSIDFSGYGKDYKADQLIGYGFDSICNTCDAHYSIVFVDRNEVSNVTYFNSGLDYILMLPITNTMFSTGKQLCQYIFKEINSRENFIDHFQQYAIKDSTLYIFDNRGFYENVGKFFTYIFKICIQIRAEYNGPDPIRVGDYYDPNDVTVYGLWHDGTTTVLTPDLYTFNSLQVSEFGTNTFTVTYVRNTDLQATFTIEGFAIKAIRAEYNGPEVWVQDEYNPDYVTVEAILLDDSIMPVSNENCIFPERIIIDNKYNWKECIYIDEYGDKWACQFSVQGIPRPIELIPVFIGPLKVLDDKVYQHEFKVQVKYLLNIFDQDSRQTEIIDITSEQWKFADGDVITEKNDGWITLSFTEKSEYAEIVLYADCYVPYIGLNATLKAWYEGFPIEVGESYDLPDVVIYVCQPGKDRIRLLYNDSGVIMDMDNLIRKEGANFFVVQYINRNINIKAKYIVPGIIYKKFPDGDFQVLYIVKGTFEEIDLTEDFRPYFTYQGNFVITWQQFLQRVIKYYEDGVPYFGMFRVVAPKETGLYNKYATEWHVYCYDDFNLEAEIFKIYSDEIEEDNDDGKTEEEPDSEHGGLGTGGDAGDSGGADGEDSSGAPGNDERKVAGDHSASEEENLDL